MRQLVKSIFLVGASTLASTGVAVVRNKLLAVILGPSGVGLFAQLLGFQNMAAGLVPLGMQTGALRYIAKYRAEDSARLARFVATAGRLFVWLSVATMVLCLVFVRPLSLWALDSTTYLWLMIPPIVGIPFLVQSQMWLTYVQAGLDIKSYSQALVTTSVVGLVVLVPLVLLWHERGAAVHVLVFAAVGYVVARLFADRAMGKAMRGEMRHARFDGEAAWNLSRFAWANLPTFALTLIVPFVIRTQIVHDQGLTANGIYQALFAISTQYLAIPVTAMVTYSFPRISQLEDVRAINVEVNKATRAVLLFSAAGIMAVLLLRDVVIRVLFSGRFLDAVPLFPVQMIGDVFKAVGWAIQLPLLPQERFRARVVMALIQHAVLLGVFYAVPPAQRLQGAVWAHLASWVAHVAIHCVYLGRVNGFRFTPQNLRLFAYSLAGVTAVAAMPFPDWRWRLAGLAVALVWAAFALSAREIQSAMAYVRARLEAAGPRPGD